MAENIFIKFKQTLTNYGLEWFKIYYGAYRGKCESNKDPLNLGRIKISCPQLYGNKTPSTWVFPRGTIGQVGAGIFWVPEPNDPILITCENGDPRYPMWEWSHWQAGAVPLGAIPGNYVLATPLGHRIELDDNNQKVLITNKAGFQVELRLDGIFVGKDGTFNLGKFLTDLLTLNEQTKTATQIGPQPFINVAAYTALKNELSNWIKTS